MIAADIEDWKLDLAKEMGADVVINTKSKDIKQVGFFLTRWRNEKCVCVCVCVCMRACCVLRNV